METAPPPDFSLQSLNKLYPDAVFGGRGDAVKSGEDCCEAVQPPCSSSFSGRPGLDPVGSLSDSLYDSFSSCTSQGSNDV